MAATLRASTAWGAAVALLALGMSVVAARAEERPRFVYLYKPPVTVAHSGRVPLLVPPAPELTPQLDALQRKLGALAEAIGIPFNPSKAHVKLDPDEELRTYSYGPYRFKVYLRSGMIRYANTRIYNAIPEDFEKQQVLSEASAIRRAKEFIGRLDARGVLDGSEILWGAPHIYYRKLGEDTGKVAGATGPPRPGTAHAVDTRVFLSRTKSGLPVSGHGVRLVFSPDGELAAVNLMWRDLAASRETYDVVIDKNRARQEFEASIALPADARVEVLVDELVYLDSSPRESVRFLEPGFLFVYVTKVPLKEKPGVFAVSKKLRHFIPATRHGLIQAPSLRKARLERLEKEIAPDVKLRPGLRDEGELPHR